MPRPFSETERQQFLADTHIAVLSVAAADNGPPVSVPIWYDYTVGGAIRINTGAKNRVATQLKRTGAATLVVQREELPYQYVVVEGTVVEALSPAPAGPREAIAARYLGEEGGREFARNMDGTDAVLFTIQPDRWRSADFSGDL